MDREIAVSIICNTYNHELYIKDALEGFVMQKTNFAFEILIHDDASTDRTANIIREYESKYPDLVKPIYQLENRYSKGEPIGKTYQFPRVRGKYIALCEGDDYWTDPYKLQKQYDAMEANTDVDICTHGATMIESNTGRECGKVCPVEHNCIIPQKQVIKGGGAFVATASIFYRSELNRNIPKFREMSNLDYTTQVHGALRGGMLYIADNMSVYRFNVPGSWTKRTRTNFKYKHAHNKRIRAMEWQLNRDTHYKYFGVIFQEYCKDLLKDIYYLTRGFLERRNNGK